MRSGRCRTYRVPRRRANRWCFRAGEPGARRGSAAAPRRCPARRRRSGSRRSEGSSVRHEPPPSLLRRVPHEADPTPAGIIAGRSHSSTERLMALRKGPIRVLHFGLGPIGAAVVRQCAARRGFKIVGAVDIDPAKAGRDLGDVAGSGGSSASRCRPTPGRPSRPPGRTSSCCARSRRSRRSCRRWRTILKLEDADCLDDRGARLPEART